MTLAELPPRAEENPHPDPMDPRDAFWARVLAAMTDMLTLSFVFGFVNFVYGVTQVTSGSPIPPPGSGFTQYTTYTTVGWGWLTLIWMIYFIGLEALFGATIGKWLFRLRVTNDAGQRTTFWQIVTRNIARIVDALPGVYLIGGVLALLSSRRQRIGDHLGHTLVISRASLAAPLLTATQLRRRLALVSSALLLAIAFSAVFFYYGRPPLVIQSMANTGDLPDGILSYTLGKPTWGSGTVTYQMTYRTTHSTQPCDAHVTLVWRFPTGWGPGNAVTSCGTYTP